MTKITELNVDVLLIILSYCSETDHLHISKVCCLFERIIEEYFYEKKCRDILMVSHLKNNPDLFERTLNGRMKYSKRLNVYKNWQFGTCQQIVFFQHRENYETILEMDQNYIYTSQLGEFSLFRRKRENGLSVTPYFSIGSKNSSKITSFKRRGGFIAGCKTNGAIFTYDDDNEYNEEFVREDELLDIDFFEDTFVTISRSEMNFHRLSTELGMETFDYCKSLPMNFQTINFNPNGKKILASKSDSLHMIDPKNAVITNSYLNRSQIFNTKWLNDQTFAYTSYGCPLSLIDTRMDFKRMEFSCGNFTATAIDYDGRYGILYGTLLGMIVLCDLRNLSMFERVFHLDSSAICRHVISDEAHLYVSTDNGIHLLNFDY